MGGSMSKFRSPCGNILEYLSPFVLGGYVLGSSSPKTMCLFPSQNFALFLRNLGPKFDNIRTRGLEILNQVAIRRKGLGSPN